MMKYYHWFSTLVAFLLLILSAKTFSQSGSLDASFDDDGIANLDIGTYDEAFAVAVRQDGIITVAGKLKGSLDGNFTLIQYLQDGSLNTSFGTNGTSTLPVGTFSEARSITYLPDNSILVGGYGIETDDTPDFALARCLPNGVLDSTFGINGCTFTDLTHDDDDFSWSIAVQADGKIVMGGIDAAYNQDFALTRYHSNGTPDSSFGVNGIVISDPLNSDYNLGKDVVIQEDGKMLLGGSDDGYPVILRYHPDGTLDNSYNGTGYFLAPFGDTNTEDVELQADGKALLAGSFYGSIHQAFVYRFLEDGTPDITFGVEGLSILEFDSLSVSIRDMTIQNDGKIIIGGMVAGDFLICRLNTDGMLDSTFNGTGMVTTDINGNDRCNAIALQPDGKLIAVGKTYLTSNGPSDFVIARYLTTVAVSTNDIAYDEQSSLIYPNPLFNESTFKYEIPEASLVTIQLHDLDGHHIRTFLSEKKNQGAYAEVLDLKGIAAGTYILQLHAGNYRQTIKVIKE